MKLTDYQIEKAMKAFDDLDVSGYDIVEVANLPLKHPKYAYNEKYLKGEDD